MNEQDIIAQAMSALPVTQLSAEAQYYRAYGKLPTAQQTTEQTALTQKAPGYVTDTRDFGAGSTASLVGGESTPTADFQPLEAGRQTMQQQLDTGTLAKPVTPSLQPQMQQPGEGGSEAQDAGQQPGGAMPDATLTGQQAGGRFGTQQFGRVGNDVYEIMSDGTKRKVTEAEFNQKLRAQGLNLDVIPQLDLGNVADFQAGPPAPEVNDDGSMKGPQDFASVYQDIIKQLGLTDIKAEFERVKKEYQDLQDKKAEEASDINDNPWLSENQRRGKLRKLDSKYELKENTLSNLMKYNQSLYEEGLAQAKFLTSGIIDDRNKMLQFALDREEALSELTKDAGENYDLRSVDGSLYRVNKTTGESELLIKSTDTPSGGKLTESDKEVADITNIEKVLIASRGTDGYIDPDVYQTERSRSRLSPADFDKRFSYLLSPQEKSNLGITKSLGFDSL